MVEDDREGTHSQNAPVTTPHMIVARRGARRLKSVLCVRVRVCVPLAGVWVIAATTKPRHRPVPSPPRPLTLLPYSLARLPFLATPNPRQPTICGLTLYFCLFWNATPWVHAAPWETNFPLRCPWGVRFIQGLHVSEFVFCDS